MSPLTHVSTDFTKQPMQQSIIQDLLRSVLSTVGGPTPTTLASLWIRMVAYSFPSHSHGTDETPE